MNYAVMLVVLLASVLASVVWPGSAGATPAKPPDGHSYYISTTSTSAAESLGCSTGTYDKNNGQESMFDILDFGGQSSTTHGTKLVNGTQVTNGQIEDVSEFFAFGYYHCSSSSNSITLAIATNNSWYTSNSLGGIWGNLVDDVRTSTAGSSVASRITFWGGNDIEAFDGDGDVALSTAWTQGFDNSTTQPFINFGSADGCSQTGVANGRGIYCGYGWYQNDYWYVSWGEPAAHIAPEIYFNAQANSWTQICRYGNNEHSSAIAFQGPMTEYYADMSTNTPAQSFSALYNALAPTVCAQTPAYEISQTSQ